MPAVETETEALTVRIPREAADLLRRLAAADPAHPEPVEDLAGRLLADAAHRRRRGLKLRDRRVKVMDARYQRLKAAGMTDEQMVAEIDRAVREVRAEHPLRGRAEWEAGRSSSGDADEGRNGGA